MKRKMKHQESSLKMEEISIGKIQQMKRKMRQKKKKKGILHSQGTKLGYNVNAERTVENILLIKGAMQYYCFIGYRRLQLSKRLSVCVHKFHFFHNILKTIQTR
jgi:hypothetical protein